MAEAFTWGSLLGVGVALFLVGAVLHLVIGVLTPIAIRTFATGDNTLIVSNRSDTKTYGSSPHELIEREPAVRTFRDAVWTIMAGLMVGLAILEIVVIWFGLRLGEPWALPTLVIEGVLLIVYWMVALAPYVAAKAPLTFADLPPFMWVPATVLIPAAVCSWLGLR